MPNTLDGRNTMVCTYGANLTLLTTGGGKSSEHMDYSPEAAIELAGHMIEVARDQIARRSEA